MRGMLQLRNTPDPECKLSPAQVLFGRPLRDAFSFLNRCPKFTNPAIQPIWRDAWAAKEDALRTRFARSVEKLNSHARQLPQLQTGERVFIQNQTGPHPNKWDRSGVVLEPLGHDQYSVKVDGTGRVTKRNRRFLRQYTLPATTSTPLPVHHPDRTPTNVLDAPHYAPVQAQTYVPSAPENPPLGEIERTQESIDVPASSSTSNSSENMPSGAPESAPGSALLHTPVPTSGNTSVHISSPATVHTPVKRGPGRPPKQRHFNFMRKEPVQLSSSPQLPLVPQSSSQSSPSTTPASLSLVPPPTTSIQASPQPRPRRIRCHVKKYDASTGKWS